MLRAADKAISIFAAWCLSFSVFGWRIAFEIGDEGHDCQQFVIHALLEHMTLERYVGILAFLAVSVTREFSSSLVARIRGDPSCISLVAQ